MKTKTSSNYVIIICRLDSKRFKFKALKEYKNKTVIEHLVNNILSTNQVQREKIIISTSKDKNDKKLEFISKKLGIKIFRGSKKNIINRIFNTYKKFGIQKAIITSADNPFFLTDVFDKIKNLNGCAVKYVEQLPVGLNLLNCNFKLPLKYVVVLDDELLNHLDNLLTLNGLLLFCCSFKLCLYILLVFV